MELRGEDLVCYSNKTKPVSLRKCLSDVLQFHAILKRYHTNGLITIAIRARFEYDSTTIRLQHATTRYEVFRSLAYEIVYENQW